MNLIIFALLFAGCNSLILGMERHAKTVWVPRTTPPFLKLLKPLAYGLWLIALWLAIRSWGAAIGASVWFGLLGAAALMVALMLSYRPRWLQVAGVLLLAGCACLTVLL